MPGCSGASSATRWHTSLTNSSAGEAIARCEPGSTGKATAACSAVARPSDTASCSARPQLLRLRRISSTYSSTLVEKRPSKKDSEAAVTSSRLGAARPSAVALSAASCHGSHTKSATEVSKYCRIAGGRNSPTFHFITGSAVTRSSTGPAAASAAAAAAAAAASSAG
eukprot:scaffold144222_cov72-Phaeocystis_antarctica.AAC.1